MRLDLSPDGSLEERQVAVRDFLYSRHLEPITPTTLQLRDGTSASGRHPRLIWLIEELLDPSGNSLPDLTVLGFDLEPGWLGWARLSDVRGIEVPD